MNKCIAILYIIKKYDDDHKKNDICKKKIFLSSNLLS